jgi:NAD(P)H dehydrogenase (quinone)
MIIVTGATGQLGEAIARRLLEHVPASRVGVSVRDVEKAKGLAALGIRVRQGDFSDPSSLSHAFEGAERVLIVSSNARATGGNAPAQHRSAIDAARAAGARRVFYTSHMAASASSAFPPMLDHAATEQLLAQSGLAWTSLRNGFYASAALSLLAEGLKTGVVEAPIDGKVSWTTHADLAEAAALLLLRDDIDGPTPPLTAGQALDLSELAAIATATLGRPIRREVTTDEQLRVRMAERGLPPHVAELALGLYRASRQGEFSAVNPKLSQLLGRDPTTMQELLRALPQR